MKEDITLLNFLGYCLMFFLVVFPLTFGMYFLGWKIALSCVAISGILALLMNLAYVLISAE